ncbi:MAG: DNA-packaging protein [Hyphomonadaceae bacterium]|nr:DNA-packaging protein [Hyphomonadaceae bacterium]
MGGRGAGKTRAGAEWVSELTRFRRAGRIALIGQTMHDVREVMIEGHSGLRSLPYERPSYEVSRRRLVWSNGAQAWCFSAEDPDALRGPQFDAAWCDELCFWAYPERTLQTLEHGLRLGVQPRMMVTTTPKPIPALKRLIAAPDTVVTRASTFDNERNLSPAFIAALREGLTGTLRHRREVLGEFVEDMDGVMWTRSDVEAARGRIDGPFDRIVVAVDPPASAGRHADACGIVAAAARGSGRAREALVLADASVQGVAPQVWALRVAELARSVGAHAIVAEGNNGGEMVRAVLKAAAPEFHVRLVRASDGKRARAEPIAAFYAQGRVKHAAVFPALEDEMCAFGAEDFSRSPDRLDALVWALTDLLAGGAADPQVRVL